MSESLKNKMNLLGEKGIPFLFILDFDLKKPVIKPLNEINAGDCLFNINGTKNYLSEFTVKKLDNFEVTPVSGSRYSKAFDLVQRHIHHGDSFLLNLTMPSKISTNLSLKDIFHLSEAKFKLWFKDEFVVFSPEIFIQTRNSQIHSFPMKGTIDANTADAENKLFSNEKELAEHYTIVDLIRNDLSIVAKNVKVERFRYIDRVNTNKGALLQMSSEIVGDLPIDFQKHIGDIIIDMLPAGSISGAPKKKTVEIIQNAEQYDRGYYTGVMGIFDGENIDSGVMIRYIEKTPNGLVYKSGGGITAMSDPEDEYKELIDKIYIPLNTK